MIPRLSLVMLRHPALWPEAVRAAREFRCKEWWKRLLFVPESEYLRWRITTAYGDPEAAVDPRDLVRYLRWRRAQRGG